MSEFGPILEALERGPASALDLATATGRNLNTIRRVIWELRRDFDVIQVVDKIPRNGKPGGRCEYVYALKR